MFERPGEKNPERYNYRVGVLDDYKKPDRVYKFRE